MSDISQSSTLLQPDILTRWLLTRPTIWQMSLVDEKGLSRIAQDRGLRFSGFGEDIRTLWQLGMLRADIVQSVDVLDTPDLILLEKGANAYYYADLRSPVEVEQGLKEAASGLDEMPDYISLQFHPFRYYVLYHINRVLSVNISIMQLLRSIDGYHRLLDFLAEQLSKWSSGEEARQEIIWWNGVSTLAIAAEPHTYEQLFGVRKLSLDIDEDMQERLIDQHKTEFHQHLQTMGLEQIEEVRRELCVHAELLDRNRDVHLLLRLTRGERRINHIRGKLGGSIYLLTMAEMLRRSAEEAFSTELPEEDNLGFGLMVKGARERVYGADRIIDAPTRVHQEFMRQFGLDYGVRLRWYVEGDTEYGALDAVFGAYSMIDLVNLAGQVVANRRRGIAFRDNLLSDLKTGVFSFVSIDADCEDYVRAVQQAAIDDQMCGMFFISDPDFELANFTHEELAEILFRIARANGASVDVREAIVAEVIGRASAEAIKKAVQRVVPELGQVSKGQTWGERLIRYAYENPELVNPTTGEIKRRPILEAIEWAWLALQSNYNLSRNETRVDPKTGRAIKRQAEETS